MSDDYYTVGQSYYSRYNGIVKLTSMGKCRSKDSSESRCQHCSGKHLIFDDDDVTRCQTDSNGRVFFILIRETNKKW